MAQNKPIIPDFNLAELKLSLLKENFEFQEFYENLKNDPYATCPELRKPEENNWTEYRFRIDFFEATGNQFFGGYSKAFSHLGLNDKFFPLVQESVKISTDDILSLLNPQNDISDVSSPELIKMLPFLFHSSGATQYNFGLHSGPFYDQYGNRFLQYKELITMYSWERLIKIDLRKREKQLVDEFKTILHKNYKLQKAAIDVESRLREEDADYTLETAYEWDLDLSRNRIKEGWKQLEVWKLRKQRKSFQRISLEMGQSEDLTKKRFYRAFELILGENYDKSFWKKLIYKRIEKMVKDTDKNFNKNTWNDVADLEEVKQQHKIIEKDSINEWSSDEVESDPLYTMNLILGDIEKICTKCTDIDCYNQLKDAIKNDEWEDWAACPIIYELLKS